MFSLDYHTISKTLRTMRYTGSVETSIPSGIFSGSSVLLTVLGGIIQTSVVINPDGYQIYDQKLIAEQLSQCGLLEWRLTNLPHMPSVGDLAPSNSSDVMPPSGSGSGAMKSFPVPAPDPFTLSATSYPSRLPVASSVISSWPLIHRQVYNLSTGQYSEQDIARLLRYPPADLLKVMSDLERMEVLQRGI